MKKNIHQTPPEPESAVDICKIKTSQYEVLNCWPHAPTAFTEGLEYHDGFLYESTGGCKNTGDIGYSSLRKVAIKTGEILKEFKIDDNFFAEGLTIFRDKIIQLTYRSHRGFIYKLKSLELVDVFYYDNKDMEGWGLTHDDRHLIMSDGSNFLRLLDPITFKVIDSIPVTDAEAEVSSINELEYVDGLIYANVYGQDYVVRIDPKSGRVVGKIDFTLLSRPYQSAGPLNGITYDPRHNRWFVTGKRWPTLFELRLL